MKLKTKKDDKIFNEFDLTFTIESVEEARLFYILFYCTDLANKLITTSFSYEDVKSILPIKSDFNYFERDNVLEVLRSHNISIKGE